MMDLRIMIQMKNPESHDPETGEVIFHADMAGWSELTVVSPDQCHHETTACEDCAQDWSADYHVKISGDGGETWYGINDVPGLPSLPTGPDQIGS